MFGIRPDAVVTNSAEAQRAAADAAAGDLLAKPLGRGEVDVDDGVTPLADKMRVGRDVEIEALQTVHDAHRGDQPLALEHREVAVDRAEREVGDLRLEPGVDPVGRRMRRGRADAREDRVAFSAAFVRGHRLTSRLIFKTIMIIISVIIISDGANFVKHFFPKTEKIFFAPAIRAYKRKIPMQFLRGDAIIRK